MDPDLVWSRVWNTDALTIKCWDHFRANQMLLKDEMENESGFRDEASKQALSPLFMSCLFKVAFSVCESKAGVFPSAAAQIHEQTDTDAPAIHHNLSEDRQQHIQLLKIHIFYMYILFKPSQTRLHKADLHENPQ